MLISRIAFTVLTMCIVYSEARKNIDLFLVPEELQTILNIIYSRLPPVKLGSDQRFGLGFRLGRNADAQILIELGPQSETKALGDNPSKREHKRRDYLQETKKVYTTEDPAINAVDSNINGTFEGTSGNEPRGTTGNKIEDPVVNRLVGNVRREPKAVSQEDKQDGLSTENITASESTISSRRLQNQSPEPFFNTFMKWLSRLFQQR